MFYISSKESEKSKFSPRSLHTAPAYYRDSFLSATNSRNNKIDQQKRDFGRTCSATVTSGTETESQDDRGRDGKMGVWGQLFKLEILL